MNETILNADAVNILGEILWHAATTDESIQHVSAEHMREILGHADRHLLAPNKTNGIRFLKHLLKIYYCNYAQ